MKKILVLSTGGTIASVPSDHGLVPAMTLEEMLAFVPGMWSYAYECRSILNLDSSNIQPEEWRLIARAIWDSREDYQAIIVTHGTDTMAYTASVLSFMLLGIQIPVIITGSQLPMDAPGSDAPKNLGDAFLVAVSDIDPGVYVVFDGKIMLGCRSSKVRTTSFNAFESINNPYIGSLESAKVVLNTLPAHWGPPPAELLDQLEERVFLLKLIPGTSADFFDHFLYMGYKGLVIEAFGIGGLHYIRRDLPEKIHALLDNGIEVVVISQCTYELSDLTVYEVGQRAIFSGVIAGFDMTTETAVTKLMWAIANKKEGETVREMMHRNYCGEILDVEKNKELQK